VIKRLESLAQGSPAEVLLQASLALGPSPLKTVVTRSGLDLKIAKSALDEAFTSGWLVALEEGIISPTSEALVLASSAWTALLNRFMGVVDEFHQKNPLRKGIPREELKSRLKLSALVFNAVLGKLISDKGLIETGTWVAHFDHTIRFSPEQQAAVDRLLARFAAAPNSPPTVKECQAEIGEEAFNALVEMESLMAVSAEVVFRKADYEAMVQKIRQAIKQKGRITLAEVRDLFQTSRRYIQALLEHLDAMGVTVRDGDFRKLKQG
jgi:selenocysteine-specific elongation factor